MKTRYLIFISYARRDRNNGTGWITRFVSDLRVRLSDKFKSRVDCEVWMDDNLDENHPFPAQIEEKVRSADLLVAITSYQYLAAPWCERERTVFSERWNNEMKGRLFLVHYRNVPFDDPKWPDEFKELNGFNFCESVGPDLWLALGEDREEPGHAYLHKVHRVAQQVAKTLENLEEARRNAVSLLPSGADSPARVAGPASVDVHVLIVAPRDLRYEGELLRKRLQELAPQRVGDRDVRFRTARHEDLLSIEQFKNPDLPPGLNVVVLVVWSELGAQPGGEGDGRVSLVEGTFRVARERGASVLLYRCTRELALRPDDPELDVKVLNLREVHKFLVLFQEAPGEHTTLLTFADPAELVSRFDGDLLERVRLPPRLAFPEALVATEPPRGAAVDLDDVLHRYLHWVYEKHERLELRGIGGTTSLPSIPLEDVYVALRGVRASEDERRQSRTLFQAELISLVKGLPQEMSALQFARLIEEAEAQAVLDNPLMPLLAERDRPTAEITLSLGEAFRTERWLVLLGDPGTGKTTLLRWLARNLSRAMAPDPYSPDRRLEVPAFHVDPALSRDDPRKADLGPVRFPVLARVSEYSDALLKARKNGQTLPLVDFLGTHSWQGEVFDADGSGLNQLIRYLLRQGRVVVLLDGMDEVTASSQRDEVVHAIEAFIAEWINERGGAGPAAGTATWSVHLQGLPGDTGGNQILITSRIAGYHASPISGRISHMTVQPMQRRAVEHFCDAWTFAVYRERFGDDEASMLDARAEADALKAEIFNPQAPQLWELASNPLLITILALIYRKRRRKLPRQRSELYHTALEILIENWRFADITSEEFIYVLSPLAAQIHSQSSVGLIREDEMREIITRELARYRGKSPDEPPPRFVREVKSFLRRVREDVGLLTERSTGLYGFLHLTFQEYLAALYLVRDRVQAGQALVDRLDQPRWREPILLALGHVSSNPEWGPSARARLLRQILDADDAFQDQLPRGPLLVISALPEMENIPPELVTELLDRLIAAYTLSAGDEAFSALLRQIEKAVNTVYNSRLQEQVVENLAKVLAQAGSGSAADVDRGMVCARLIRANGWNDARFLGPLLRCQPFDDIHWALPATAVLRSFFSRSLRVGTDQGQLEREVERLRTALAPAREQSREAALRSEISMLKEQITRIEAEPA